MVYPKLRVIFMTLMCYIGTLGNFVSSEILSKKMDKNKL